ncbi:uncharacterized protein C8orf76 homolog isoform X2 [Strix uralensis]|uniref:uncharacterized protein C8orf76 homolog isoform X2 n=1 Tax=Strix uralensis TaxID=36305 RepID=UPI003DA51D88
MAATPAARAAPHSVLPGGSTRPRRRPRRTSRRGGPAGGALRGLRPERSAAMEPVLGWQFEESLFGPSRERGPGGGAEPPCGAKHCEPLWFRSEADGGEGAGELTVSKFRADWAYRQQEFERNSATNTDHLTTVLNLQFAVYQGLENVEKKITCLQQLICLHPFNPWYWKLLAEVYMSLLQSLSPLVIPETNLNQSEEVSVRAGSFKTSNGREINLQPHRSDSQKEGPWSVLATETKSENTVTCSSSQAVKEFLCTSEELERTDEGKHTASESWEQNMLKKVGIKACASFIRARLLLQLTQLQQSSFALENNIQGQKEIDDKVARLGFNENSLLLMTKVMGQDLIPEKLKEEFQGEVKCIGPSALSSVVTASATEFEIKWFGNLQDDLCHLDRQFCSDIYLLPLAT